MAWMTAKGQEGPFQTRRSDLPFAPGSFDFATAFMSMMDMVDQGRALCEAARVLRPGGFLQFSILHPCFVPPHRRVLRDPDGTTRAIEIAGYFDATDGRIDTFWLTTVPQEERDRTEPFRVPRFHRTLSAWVDLIIEAGWSSNALANRASVCNWRRRNRHWKTRGSRLSFCISMRLSQDADLVVSGKFCKSR
jgi:SAM-dependent methyltransferase